MQIRASVADLWCHCNFHSGRHQRCWICSKITHDV